MLGRFAFQLYAFAFDGKPHSTADAGYELSHILRLVLSHIGDNSMLLRLLPA